MRATQGTTYRALQAQINLMNSRLIDLRMIAASGKKLNKPSDDPAAIRPVLNARATLRADDRYVKTLGYAGDYMQTMEGHLSQIDNILQRAKETAINAVNGTMSDEDRTVLADQIANMRDELLDTANAKMNNRYMFAGFKETTQPFAANPAYDPNDPASAPMLYNGDDNPTVLEIGPGESIEVGVTGNELFLGDADSDGVTDAGKVDMFATLTRLEAAIRANDTDEIATQTDNLDTAAEQNSRLLSDLGNNELRVESATAAMNDAQYDVGLMLSRYQDADLIQAYSDMTQQETALQAALQVSAQVSKLSILNYL